MTAPLPEYRKRPLKIIALRASLQFWSRLTRIVTVFFKRYRHRYKQCDACLLPLL